MLVVINMDEILYPDNLHPSDDSSSTRKHRHPDAPNIQYDPLRFWSAATHAFGDILSVMGTLLLLIRASALNRSPLHWFSFLLYCCSMITLYVSSTLYHCIRCNSKGRTAFRKLDHASIYFLIAGTYTPVCLIALRGTIGWLMFITIWLLAITGFMQTLFWINAPRQITAGIYIVMGWLAITAIYPLSMQLSFEGLLWLLLGGVLYTVGGVFYALKWPGRNNPKFGFHEIFHVLIILGSICHFLLMYRIIVHL